MIGPRIPKAERERIEREIQRDWEREQFIRDAVDEAIKRVANPNATADWLRDEAVKLLYVHYPTRLENVRWELGKDVDGFKVYLAELVTDWVEFRMAQASKAKKDRRQWTGNDQTDHLLYQLGPMAANMRVIESTPQLEADLKRAAKRGHIIP